jgi:GWxTD domain-containing protein
MLSHLPFYFEIYNHAPGTSTEFFVTYAIEKSDGLGNIQTITKAHKKRKAAELVPVLTQLDVSKLESGNYNLMVEVRNSANELLDQKRVFFQRSNPYLNINSDSLSTDELATEFVSKLDSFTLSYSLRAIMYRVPATDVPILNGLIASGNSEAQRRFLFSYWAGSTPNFAEATYNKYMEIANALDNMYRNGFGYGFETDRGRIYIKYGRPDDIHSVENEPSAPPYEIWTYNVIENTKQKNVKFIFYNPSLVSNGHVLLHSNCRGETNNPRWKVELYRDDPNSWEGKNAFDAIDIQDNINRQGTRLFNDQ